MNVGNMNDNHAMPGEPGLPQRVLPDSVRQMNSDELVALSETYAHEGLFELAEMCLLRALDFDTKLKGFTHPRIKNLMDALLAVYTSQEKHAEICKLQRWRAVIEEKAAKETAACAAATAGAAIDVEKSRKLALKRTDHNVDAARTATESSNKGVTGSSSSGMSASTATAIAPVDTTAVAPAMVCYPPSILVSQLKKNTGPVKKIPASSIILSSGQEISLALGVMWLGRDPINDICLENDPAIGRSQAAISWENNEYYISNQDNATSMRINGKPVTTKSKIFSGDVIDVGRTKILVR